MEQRKRVKCLTPNGNQSMAVNLDFQVGWSGMRGLA